MVDDACTNDALCLDFANTWANRLDRSTDTLSGFDDVLEWSCRRGILTRRERQTLGTSARRRPAEADDVFGHAVHIRETMYRILSAVAAGGGPDDADIEEFNLALAEVPRRRLCRDGECCRWDWPAAETDLARVIWPVVQSAAELLTSPEVSRVRECDAPDCSWLFFDSGRGRRRRWCDMSTCGNRAKARRYYERHHRKGEAV